MRPRLLAALLAAALLLALAPAAGATLVYETGVTRPTVWIADDDGSDARRLVAGRNPVISPDGATVAFGTRFEGPGLPSLQVIPATGGAPRTLARNWQYGPFAWSPDSRFIATQVGPATGTRRLVLIEVATGTVRTIATGYFSGASFSPDGTQLVYGRGRSERLFTPTNIEVVPVAGGTPRRLTTDGRGMYPLWGPSQIVYVRRSRPTGRQRKIDGPKYHLWLMQPDGTGARQLTRGRIPFLLTGLTPTAWSADGTRLLAQFVGEDTSYPVAVDPVTGRQRRIGRPADDGILATGLSRDGSTILGATGLFTPGRGAVITVPYTGGRLATIVRRATMPTWNR